MKTSTCRCRAWTIGREWRGTMRGESSSDSHIFRDNSSRKKSHCCVWWLRHCTCIRRPTPCCATSRLRLNGSCWALTRDGEMESESCSGNDGHSKPGPSKSLDLLLLEVGKCSGLAVVQPDAALLGRDVGERNLHLLRRRINFAEFHRTAGYVLFLIISSARG